MAGYIGSKASVVSSGAERKKVFDITTSTTVLTGLSYTANQVHVFHNGVRLISGTDYTETNDTTITLTNAAENGDQVVVVSYASFQTSDTVSASAGGTFSGAVDVNADGATVLTVDRATSDGDIVSFRKDGSTVGSIGTNSSRLTIGNGDTGLLIAGDLDNITPFNTSTNASRDAAVDLGNSGVRFKDLYLSNSVKVISATNGTSLIDLGDTSDSNIGRIAYDNSVNAMYFTTSNNERMRIRADGAVLINRTTQVAGGQVCIDYTNGVTAGMAIKDTNTSGTGVPLQVVNGSGSIVGSITQNQSSTAFNTSSDYRLKTDAQPMTGASARVQALNPVNFEWIADGTRVDGFLAHEAQAVVPEAVTGTKDAVDADGNPVYQGIDQSKLVPLLTAALQEALTKIDALETRITALEAV